MTSSKPYMIRALYDWINDNGFIPYILVNANAPACYVPEAYVANGRIVFNIAPTVVEGLVLGNDVIEFTARFSGVSQDIFVPVAAVLAIYAKENGEGMAFPAEEFPTQANSDKKTNQKKTIPKGKPKLTIVK